MAGCGAANGRTGVAAMMTGKTQEEYAKMMIDGGRTPDGNRYKSEWENKK